MVCKTSDKPKQKHKKGLWSPDEDMKLKNYILKHGHGCWSSVPLNAGALTRSSYAYFESLVSYYCLIQVALKIIINSRAILS